LKLTLAILAVTVAALTLTVNATPASTHAIARSPHKHRPAHHGWHAPPSWLVGAICVHEHESGDWHYGPAHHPSTGASWNGYYNGFQFTLGTFERAERLTGIHADPEWAPIPVQVRLAYAIWHSDGGSWREWPTSSRLCGLR